MSKKIPEFFGNLIGKGPPLKPGGGGGVGPRKFRVPYYYLGSDLFG